MPITDDRENDHVSSAVLPENVGFPGCQEDLRKIVAAGPRGAVAVAGLAVGLLLVIWFAFLIFVFLPRGAIG